MVNTACVKCDVATCLGDCFEEELILALLVGLDWDADNQNETLDIYCAY